MELFDKITKGKLFKLGKYHPISSKYSDDMRTLIQQMMVVDP